MIATSYSATPENADSALDPDLLAEIAGLRARGSSWDETAAAVRWDPADLRRVLRPDRAYAAVLEAARREVDAETEALALQTLRGQMGGTNTVAARAAAKIVLDHTARQRADELKLRIERERAKARGAKGRAGADEEEPEPEQTPEEAAKWERVYYEGQARKAEEVAREKAVVFLWGGCHPIGDAPPDATDTPLALVSDTTAVRGRTIRWAVTDPMPTEPRAGPFLAPPGCRPRTCPELPDGFPASVAGLGEAGATSWG